MAPASLSLSDAWERFGCFHDSVIRRAEFYLRQPRRLTVDLDAWEPGELADTGIWMDGRFRFDDVREYRLWEQNWAIEVIFEAGWAELDDLIWVAFDGDDMDEVAPTVARFRDCYAYVAAKSVELTVSPFSTD
jgi:hypothetical protein